MAKKEKNMKQLSNIDEDEIVEDTIENDDIEEVRNVVKKSKVIVDDEDYEDISVEERIENIEKKVNLTLILVIIILILSLFVVITSMTNSEENLENKNTATENNSSSSTSYDTSAFKEISATDIKTESKNETIVVLIGRQGCGYCAAYAPIITQAANNYGVKIRYIDFAKIVNISAQTITDSNAYDTIKNLEGVGEFKDFASTTAIRGTPNTLFIKNNKIVYAIEGYNELATVESAFEKAGFSK